MGRFILVKVTGASIIAHLPLGQEPTFHTNKEDFEFMFELVVEKNKILENNHGCKFGIGFEMWDPDVGKDQPAARTREAVLKATADATTENFQASWWH